MKKLSSVSLFCSAIIFLTQYGDLNEVWAAAAVTWQEEWSKTVQAAEKEGQVVLYANEGLEGSVSDFQKKFPKIKVVVVAGRSGQLVTRLMAERRAGKYLADVAKLGTGSAAALYRARPFPLQEIDGALFLPEVMDRSKWWGNNRQYADPEGKYLLSPCVSVHIDLVSYNTELLKPADVTSYWDILNPKWKGKIGSMDPRAAEAEKAADSSIFIPSSGRNFSGGSCPTWILYSARSRGRRWIGWPKASWRFCFLPRRAKCCGPKRKSFPWIFWTRGT